MDDSDMGFSSTPTKPSAIPKSSSPDAGGADENDQNYNKMDPKFHNPKKPLTKHFMSPTISAASKAAIPRKKILVERNEESPFSDTHLQNAPNQDSKTTPLNLARSSRSSSRVTSSYSSAPESDDHVQQNPFVADSALKPYDPLMNYLSPRPKFLRYKPNRRRDIFRHRENETREEKNGFDVERSVSFDSQKATVEEDLSAHGSWAASSQECPVEQENEGLGKSEGDQDDDDEEEEEFEEFEDQRGCSLKGVFEFLVVILALFLSTLYISSMNSPTPSPTLQAIWDLKEGYNRNQNHVFEAFSLKILEGGSESFDPREETQVGPVEMDNREDGGFEKEVMVEDDNMVLVESTDELGEVVELQSGDVSDGEMEKTEKKVFDQLKGPEITSEVVYMGSDHLGALEKEEKCAAFEDYQEPYMAELVEYGDFDFSGSTISEREVNVNSTDEEVEIEDKVKPVDRVSDEAASKEVVEHEMERVEDITNNAMLERTDSENTNSETINPEMEANSKEGIIEHLETEMFPGAVFGFSIFFMITSSVVLGFQLRRKKGSVKDTLPMEKLPSEPLIAEKISHVLPDREEGQIEKVESFLNPSSLIRSVDEASQGFYQSRAPTVELLGEFVVGELSSSLKSCGMKSKMMETEESKNSVSREKGTWSKARVVSSQAHPSSALESSTMDSPSYGSFTAEKKIGKKEEGKDGEVRMVVTTPVRRSSRIRNLAVMSP
ncbi:hypothetical protein F0562_022885 [Nyssa sinensis]|uniref:Uncharacterized protein n=1 Tax=Nyssa sinensis TaxID=561372 RepID=A0A5J5BF18_9ASTE|nr:hypothetical protein F0562_022885 [Nyssa sinensis]